MVTLKNIRETQQKKIINKPRLPAILKIRGINNDGKNQTIVSNSSIKKLWSHLVFIDLRRQKTGNVFTVSRIPTTVFGLFNQLFALFASVDITKILGRNKLVIGHFYLNYNNPLNKVPLSKIIQLDSLLVHTIDWNDNEPQPHPCNVYRTFSIDTLQKKKHIQDIEIGCCFLFPLPEHKREEHIQRMCFHPILYELVSSFLFSYPKYQVIHYRMENDFSGFFFEQWKFSSLGECRENLFQQYQKKIKEVLDPNIPTLVVSHYYKDSEQVRDYDLQWKNLIHFILTPEQKSTLYNHLQFHISTPIREVDAVIDFILCTKPNVSCFIGCGGSTFSNSVCLYHNNQNCHIVDPVRILT